MAHFFYFNGTLRQNDRPFVHTLSSATLYGKGVFTTVAIHDRSPFLWDKHWRRLCSNAERLGINITEHRETSIRSSLKELIAVSEVVTGRARITFLDESASLIWPFKAERKTSLLITTAGLRTVPPTPRLTISPHKINSTSPLVGIKSCNYLDNILAYDEAQHRGFDEAVRVNERGEVTSACMANIFWLRDGQLFTPDLSTGCLPGTTREFVLENLECSEVKEPIDSLKEADAIFLTSAGLGVAAAGEFAKRGLTPIQHPVLELIA
jgi:branched-chain amino acid aminotransferase